VLVRRSSQNQKQKPRLFPNPGGVFLGVFPGWVYFRCILRRVFLLVYFPRGISFIFCAVSLHAELQDPKIEKQAKTIQKPAIPTNTF
jgi:hypothetical protein